MKKPRTFRKYIRFQFIIYALIPLVLMMALFFGFFVFITQSTIRQKTAQANTAVANIVAHEMESCASFIVDFTRSQPVRAFFDGGKRSELFWQFYQFNSRRDIKSTLYLLDTNGGFLLSSRKLSAASEDFFKRFVFGRVARQDQGLFSEMDALSYENGQAGVYLLAAPVQSDGAVIGYAALLLEEESFFNAINVANNEVSLVTDGFGNVLTTNSGGFVNRYNKISPQIPVGIRLQAVAGIDYYIAKSKLPGFDLWVYSANGVTQTQALYSPLFVFMVMLGLGFSALVWFLSGKLSERASASVTQMIDAVRHTRNAELDYRVDIRTGDEFQELGEQFNKMQVQIETLLRNNAELTDLSRDAEVKRLEAHFNPHFIFNVLETLRYSLYFDQNVSQEIITSLSRLLKYSIYSENQESALTEDLRYTEEYLRLHKYRLGDKMTYEMHSSEEVEFALVPKLVLQPIIENSVKYGYHKHNAVRVILDARLNGTWLELEVSDDGGGMSEDLYKEILNNLAAPELPPQHTGLYNIHRRLTLMYGADSGLEIRNDEGKGLSVLVRLPFRIKG